MARVATLGTAIDSGGAKKGADETRAALDSITQAAVKTTAAVQQSGRVATQSLTEEVRAVTRLEAERNRAANEARRRAQAEAADAARRAAIRQQEIDAAERARRAQDAHTQAMGRAEAAAYELDAAFNKKAAGALASEAGMNRLRSSATALLPALTGINGAAGTAISTLGNLAAGSGVTLAIVAGVGAISAVYTALTADAKRLREENQKAVASLRELAGSGRATSLNEAIRKARQEELALTRQLTEAEAALRRAQSGQGYAGAKTGLVDPSFAAEATRLQKQIADTQRAIADGRRELGRVLTDTAQDYSRAQTQALADLVRSGNATVAEQTKLRDRLRNLQGQLTQATAAGEDPAKRAELVAQIKTITDVYDEQAEAAKRAADARVKSGRELITFEQAYAASLNDVTRKLADYDAAQNEALTKATTAIGLTIDARALDIQTLRDQIAVVRSNADAYNALTIAREQERAVADARAKMPKGAELSAETETRIRAQVKEYLELKKVLDALRSWDGSSPFTLPEDTVKNTRAWESALRDVVGTLRDLGGALNGTGSDAVKMLGAVMASVEGLMRARERAAQMQADGQRLTTGQQWAAAGAGAIGAFGGGYAIGSTTTSRATGFLGGAAAGAATGAAALAPTGIGAPIGALIGGIIGGIGGLLGASDKGKQAAVQMEIAQKQLGKALDGIKATFANDSLGAAIAQARAQFDDLRKSTEAAYSGRKNEAERKQILAELTVLEARRVEQLKAQYAVELQLATNDLEVRRLRAVGLTAEADALERVNTAQRELTNAIQQYGEDSTYVEKLKETQAAQAAAAESARLLAEAERQVALARRREDIGADLTARGQTLTGDTRGAFITRQNAGAVVALREAEDLFKAGAITAEMFAELTRIINEELLSAIRDFDQAAADAAERRRAEAEAAEQQRVARIQQDQTAIIREMTDAYRVLNPQLAAELAAQQVQIDRAARLAAATDDVTRAQLEQLFSLQDQVTAYEASARAAESAARAVEAQTRAAERLAQIGQDVDERFLRATGQTFEADRRGLERERDSRIAEVMAAFAALGMPTGGNPMQQAQAIAAQQAQMQDLIAKIQQTFDADLARLIASTMTGTPASTAAGATDPTRGAAWNPGRMADIPVLGGDSVTYRSAASMTETSATRLIDFASAQLSVQRDILAELRGRRGGASDLLGPAVIDRIDTALGTRMVDSAMLVNGQLL